MEWINSLFDPDITRLTPLDFRLVAAAQFRLLAFMCSAMMTQIKELWGFFTAEQLLNSEAMSVASVKLQADAFFHRFKEFAQYSQANANTYDMVVIVAKLSHIPSAVHTNAFQLVKPRSDHSHLVDNFYPMNNNASFTQVSLAFLSDRKESIALFSMNLLSIVHVHKRCLNHPFLSYRQIVYNFLRERSDNYKIQSSTMNELL